MDPKSVAGRGQKSVYETKALGVGSDSEGGGSLEGADADVF